MTLVTSLAVIVGITFKVAVTVAIKPTAISVLALTVNLTVNIAATIAVLVAKMNVSNISK